MSSDKLKRITQLLLERSAAVQDAPRLRSMHALTGPASYGQRSLWLAHQRNPSTAYHIVVGLQIRGTFDSAILEQALGELVQRQAQLRTGLVLREGELLQEVVDTVTLQPERFDISDGSDEERRDRLLNITKMLVERPFDLAVAPLARLALVKLGPELHALICVLHHCISDGWSQNVIAADLAQAYARYAGEPVDPRPDLTIQYLDFSLWQHELVEGEVGERQLRYWREKLRDAPPTHGLVSDQLRHPEQAPRSGRHEARLDAETVVRLHEIAAASRASLFHALLSLYAAVVGRFADVDDVVIGFASANRSNPALQGLIGYLVNSLPARIDLGGDPGLVALLPRVRDVVLEAIANQDVPLDVLIDRLGVRGDGSANPMMQLFFSFQEKGQERLRLGTLELEPLMADMLPRRAPKFDITLTAERDEGGVSLVWEFDANLFDAATIRLISEAFVAMAIKAATWPEAGFGTMALADEGCVSGPALDTGARPLLARFRDHVRDYPGRLAIVENGVTLTYEELDRRSDNLAACLKKAGVEAGNVLASLQPRGIGSVVCMLAAFKIEAVFAPFDPSMPLQRLEAALSACDATLVVLDVDAACDLDDMWPRCILGYDDHQPVSPIWVRAGARKVATSAAYIVHTSGSTGIPKGVVIDHDNLAHFVAGVVQGLGFRAGWTFGIVTNPATDMGLGKVLASLGCGGTLHMLDDRISRDPALFAAYLEEHPLDVLKFTPNHYLALFQPDIYGTRPPAQVLILAGERLTPDALAQLHGRMKGAVIVNSYGPCECSVACSAKILDGPTAGARVSIGTPFPGMELRVVNRAGGGQPSGAVGELWVVGPTVGQGYVGGWSGGFGRDNTGTPIYRTGDIVRRRADGEIEFLERRDTQVKIRGYRVELSEVEGVLRSLEGVANAYVRCVTEPDGDAWLCAYFVGCEPIDLTAARAALARQLPDYMRPRHLVQLAVMPLRENGKVDLDALPLPTDHVARAALSEPPRTPTEVALAAAWSEVLGVVVVDRHADFFALGGNSIRAIRATTAAARHGLALDPGQLLRRPRLDELASQIDQQSACDLGATVPLQPFELTGFDADEAMAQGIEDAYPLTALQEAMIGVSSTSSISSRYVIVRTWRWQGSLDTDALAAAVDWLIASQPVLRTSVRVEAAMACVQMRATAPIDWHDLSAWPQEEQQHVCRRLIAKRRATSFNFAVAPLFHLDVIRLSSEESVLVWTAHHAILDGWSVAKLFEYAATAYDACKRGLAPPAVAGTRGLAQLVLREREAVAAPATRAYWSEQASQWTDTSLPVLPEQPMFEVSPHLTPMLRVDVPATLVDELIQTARARRVSLKAVAFAAYTKVLATLSGQSQVTTGYCTHRREATYGSVDELGLYVTTLPVVIDTNHPTWGELVDAAHRLEKELWPHRHMPLIEIQRLGSGQAPFEHFFNFNDFTDALDVAGHGVPHDDGDIYLLNEFALTINFVLGRAGRGATLHVNYDPTRQSGEQATLFAELMLNALHGLRTLSVCPQLLTGVLRDRVLHTWNRTARKWDTDICLHEPVLNHALTHPDRTALVDVSGTVSFVQFGERTVAWVRALEQASLAAGETVGILLPRGRDQFIAATAVLAAGGVYVPLDPDWPPLRRDAVLAEAGVRLVLAEPEEMLLSQYHRIVPPDIVRPDSAELAELYHRPRRRRADDAAYIIYTSGSTGRPKGVVMTHRAVVNTLLAINELVGLEPDDRVLSVSSLTFDLSVYDLFGVLGAGAAAVLLPPATAADPESWLQLARTHRVSIWNSVPLAAQLLLEAAESSDKIAPIRHFLLSGDRIPATLPQRLKQRFGPTKVTSLGGATEAAIWSISHPIECDTSGWRAIPYGRPLPNQRFYVLGADDRPVPPGALGQLHIAGDGLALGYHHDAERTLQNFFEHAELGERLYRTGDLGRYLPDGTIEIVGRLDHQVKVRGYRIELGDIEASLRKCGGILDAVVVLRAITGASEPHLVAYVVGTDVSPSVLRRHVASELPAYMVPQAYVALAQMPRNANGKLDRDRLPEPTEVDFAQTDYVSPSNATEHAIAEVWQRVLGRVRIGVEDHFFELGGDSILALRLVSECERAGYAIKLRDFYAGPTIADMALAAKAQTAETSPIARGHQLLLPMQKRYFEQAFPNPNHYNQALMLRVPPGLDIDAWRKAMAAVIEAHDALRLRFKLDDTTWSAFYGDAADDTVVTLDLASVSIEDRKMRSTAAINALQGSLDIRTGRTFRSLYLDFGCEPGRMLLIAHHLVVDAVSWQLLMRDLGDAYAVAARGTPPTLRNFGSALQQWGHYLHSEHANTRFEAQADYWFDQLASPPVLAGHPSNGVQSSSATLTLVVPAWGQLDDTVLASAGLTRHELLLAAVYLGLRHWSGVQRCSLMVEAHGRHLAEAPDVAASVGWFTAMFPLLLDVDGEDALEVARHVASRWRAVPDAGIGYGVLRYLREHEGLHAIPEPAVCFNYFGEFRNDSGESGVLRLSEESSGEKIDPQALRESLIMISAAGTPEGLKISLEYAAEFLPRAAMQTFFCEVEEALGNMLQALSYRDHTDGTSEVCCWPATPTQRGILLHSQIEPDRAVYVNQLSLRLAGGVDEERLREAWYRVVQRHTALRSGFRHLDQEVPQGFAVVNMTLPWRTVQLEAEEPIVREADLARLREQERSQPFNFATPPLMRFAFVYVGDDIELVWTFHHALLDGWSLPLVLADVQAVYTEPARALPPSAQFAEYANWLHTQPLDRARDYWRTLLRGFQEPVYVPFPPPMHAEAVTHAATLELDEAQTACLVAAARSARCTVNILVQAAWAYVLHRYTGADDVVFGATHAGRPGSLPQSDQMVGLFINSLPVRVTIEEEAPVERLLDSLLRQQANSIEHGHLSLSEIQALSELPPGTALFDSVVVFENYRMDALEPASSSADGLRVSGVHNDEGTHYPLTLLVLPGTRMRLCVRARGDVFDIADAERIAGHWREVIQGIAADHHAPLHSVPLLTSQECALLMRRMEMQDYELRHPTLAAAFADTVARFPDHIAVRSAGRALTYRELDRQANVIARRLFERGAGGGRVGLCAERDIELAVGLIGILKAGSTYVPMDPSTPLSRRLFIVDDMACSDVVTDRSNATSFGDVALVIDLDVVGDDTLPPRKADWSEVSEEAYVIYTSGTTGQPKGVVISHRSVLRLFAATEESFNFNYRDVVPLFHSFAFDVSVFEMWSAWLYGGTLVIVPEPVTRDAMAILKLLVDEGVTLLNQTPTAFEALARAEASLTQPTEFMLRHVVFAGEALDYEALAVWSNRHGLDHPMLWNLYGITETTVHTTIHRVVPEDIRPQCRRVGAPMRDLQVRIVDRRGRDVPVGISGEIWVAGAGVALGYHKRPELNASRFVEADCGSRRLRYYRSGDLGRYRDDGGLDCLGRNDRQVKIRGFRIELGEIEAQLMAQDDVEKAVVLVNGSGVDRQLVAYVVNRNGVGDAAYSSRARQRLLGILPDYMVPAAVIALADFPRNHNGKLDTAALPLPAWSSASTSAPRGDIDPIVRSVLAIWSEVLGIEVVDPDVDFFELGGHSLKLGQVITRLRARLGSEVAFGDLYRSTTPARQAALLRKTSRISVATIPRLDEQRRRAGVILSPDQLRLWYLCQDQTQNMAYTTRFALQLFGTLDLDATEDALRDVIAHHESLRTVFRQSGDQVLQYVIEPQQEQVVRCGAEGVSPASVHAFDLAKEAPFRACLASSTESHHRLDITIHHIVSDAWSISRLIADFCAFYRARTKGSVAPTALPVQLVDACAWMADRRKSGANHLEYWQHVLAGHRGLLPLRHDATDSVLVDASAGVVELHWPASLALAIRDMARARGATVYMVLMACYALLLQRWSGSGDIVVGAVVAQRPHPDLEQLIGFFANTLPVRLQINSAKRASDIIEQARERILDAIEHGDISLVDVVESLDIERQPDRMPLFQTAFTLQNVDEQRLELDGVTITKVMTQRHAAKFDLLLSLRESDSGIDGEIEFDQRRYSPSTARWLSETLRGIVEVIVADPDQALASLEPGASVLPRTPAESLEEGGLDFLSLQELTALLDEGNQERH